ncbi:MAG TPA: hypothetical protein PLO78_04500 [Candidatus Omnitrophota bacterium]|nr:hypothetical protein [Candidatus Omnitrophota bacterium]
MINVQGPKITFAQVIIVAWGVLFCAAVVLFYVFALQPAETAFETVKTQDFFLKKQLSWVRQVIEHVKDPDQVAAYFIREQKELARKFPYDEHKSLVMLSDYARKFQIHVDKISAKPAVIFKGSLARPVVVEGKTCLSVLVAMKMRAGYLNLVKYLEALRKVLPAYLTVEKMEITDVLPAVPGLEIQMELNLFLLEPK